MSSDSTCELSLQGRAFSTVLTAFVGSILTGITNGSTVAFLTAWINWFAVARVLSGSLFGLYQAFSHNDIRNVMGHDWLVEDVTVLGWIGWLYTVVYSPIVQSLWLVENWTAASPALLIVRALGISVSALSLTIDSKKRYAGRLRDTKYIGYSACVVFKIMHALSAFGMGIMCAALLIKGAIDAGLRWYVYILYCVCSVIWARSSFQEFPLQDGGIKGFGGIIGGVLMGAFTGVILAAPAFVVLLTAEKSSPSPHGGFSTPESGRASLQHYLSCKSVATWQKFVAIFP